MRRDATIHSIQLLRSIAATLVVLFHAQLGFSTRVSEPVFPHESYVFGFGAVGVHVFFVISGFIMVLTSGAQGTGFSARKFLRRRFLRIYPIYWICAIAYLVVQALLAQPVAAPAGEIVAAFTLWPEHASVIIGPAWTLSYEMYFYICFGLAMTLGLTRGLIALAVLFVSAIAIGLLIPDKGVALNLVTNALLLEFLAGTAIGWLTVNRWLPSRGGPALVATGLALFAAGLWFGYDRLPSAVVWGVPSAVVVLGLVMTEQQRGASPRLRWWARLGDSSYVLYLIHILVITVAVSAALAAGLPLAPPVAAVVIAGICILLAEAIHRGIEQPMLRRLNPPGTGAKRASPPGEARDART